MPRKIRPIRIEGNIAFITLTQGKVAVIDAADVPLVEGFNWYAHAGKGTFYARTNVTTGVRKQKNIKLHQMLMGFPGGLVDHKDCDGLNCRRNNLRVATPTENLRNSRVRKNSRTQLKGVSKVGNRWTARIKSGGKDVYLGIFKSKEDAAMAYRERAALEHGEFFRP